MARTKRVQTRTCNVTGMELPITEFYSNQSHSKVVDNFRRATGVSASRMQTFFNKLNQYA
jgi:hypothetical protein